MIRRAKYRKDGCDVRNIVKRRLEKISLTSCEVMEFVRASTTEGQNKFEGQKGITISP
jgi:hypothetical protein